MAEEKHIQSGLRYFVFGEVKKPPLLLLPGFTGTHNDVSHLANDLKEKYAVIVPEFPGWENAAQEKSTYTIASYAKIVKEIIDDISRGQVSIVAHCMGATVALETAYEFPKAVKQLILISAPYQDGTVGKGFFLFMARMSKKVPSFLRPLFFLWRSRFITTPISFFVIQTRTFRRKLFLIKDVLVKQQKQNEHVLETNWDSLIAYNYQKLKRLSTPVHLLHGEKDMLIQPIQAEKLQKILPHATLDFVPHAGHLPPVETPETLAHMIEKYL